VDADTPAVRLALGADAVGMIRQKLLSALDEHKRFEEVSLSATFDDLARAILRAHLHRLDTMSGHDRRPAVSSRSMPEGDTTAPGRFTTPIPMAIPLVTFLPSSVYEGPSLASFPHHPHRPADFLARLNFILTAVRASSPIVIAPS
jgi:hypothetical protein